MLAKIRYHPVLYTPLSQNLKKFKRSNLGGMGWGGWSLVLAWVCGKAIPLATSRKVVSPLCLGYFQQICFLKINYFVK